MTPLNDEALEYIRERNDHCELTQCDVRVLIAEIERLREAEERVRRETIEGAIVMVQSIADDGTELRRVIAEKCIAAIRSLQPKGTDDDTVC